MSVRHLNIKVSGQVQGVFFRNVAAKTANELNIKGFVRNEPDGSVYLEVEGEDDSLDKFLDWCRIGPKHAKVDDIEVNEDTMSHFDEFWIEF